VSLLVADGALHRLSLVDNSTRGLLAAAGLAVCGLAVARLVVGAPNSEPVHVVRTRRALVAVAVSSTVADLLVFPESKGEFGNLGPSPPELPGVYVVTALLVAALCVAGVCAVAGALPRPPAQVLTGAVALLLAAVMGYGGFVKGSQGGYSVAFEIACGFTVLIVVAAMSALVAGVRRDTVGWLRFVGMVIATPILFFGAVLALSRLVTPPLVAIVGDEITPSDASLLPGLVLALMALARVLAWARIGRSEPLFEGLIDTAAQQ
jgi:hypothetical protein